MFLIRRQVVGLAILPRSATWLQVFGLKVAKAWKRGNIECKDEKRECKCVCAKLRQLFKYYASHCKNKINFVRSLKNIQVVKT